MAGVLPVGRSGRAGDGRRPGDRRRDRAAAACRRRPGRRVRPRTGLGPLGRRRARRPGSRRRRPRRGPGRGGRRSGRGPARAAVDPGEQRRDHRPDRPELEPRRGRGARGLRGQRDRPVPVLQGRGAPDAGPRLRADRERGLDRRQGGQPDPHAVLGLEGGGHRDDQVPGQGAGRQGGHHGQRDLAGRDPHRRSSTASRRPRSST